MKIIILLFTAVLFSYSQLSNLNGISICIDPGHGGVNPANDREIIIGPGVTFWESEGNFRKALLLRTLLQQRGATVFLTRETNTYPNDADEPGLSARWSYANSKNVNWFHSIHSNAGGGFYTMVLLKEIGKLYLVLLFINTFKLKDLVQKVWMVYGELKNVPIKF